MHPLRAYRKSQTPPLTQDDLAEKVGVKRRTIIRWERGDRKIDEDKLPKITEVTGIPARELRPDLIAKLEKLVGVAA